LASKVSYLNKLSLAQIGFQANPNTGLWNIPSD
jgi:hypothetical protein